MLDIESGAKKEKELGLNSDSLITETELAGLNKIDNEKVVNIFGLIVLAIFVLASGFTYAYSSSKSNVLANKEANYNNLSDQLKSDKDLSALDKQATTYGNGLNKISAYLSKRLNWSILLKEFQTITPTDVVLKSINVNEKTLIASINGEANNYNTVGLLIASLDNSDKFENVKLIFASESQATVGVINFSAEAKIVDKSLLIK